jgi:hypothetical protein
MSGLEGRRQWRRDKLFKLCAKPFEREYHCDINEMRAPPESDAGSAAH